jgi:hypothetical protein
MNNIIFAEKITSNADAFIQKLVSISTKLGIEPNWLMSVINSETGGRFSPDTVNKQGKMVAGYDENGKVVKAKGEADHADSYQRAKYRATGLIQFMPRTAKGLKTTTQALYKMSNVDQLDYVYKYFLPAKGKLKSFEDLYLYTFYPLAIGKGDSYIIGSEKGLAYAKELVKQNPLDFDHDGYLSVKEFKQFIYKKIPTMYLEILKKKLPDLYENIPNHRSAA